MTQTARPRGAGISVAEPDLRGGVALFIDWDNFTASVTRELPQAPLDLQPILSHARLSGPLMVCRAYGEWQYPDERYYAYRHGVDVLYAPVLPLAQAAREAQNGGKNLATMAIAVDCVDLLHQIPELDAVVLVSNDRELLPVARLARLRGKRVVVIGTPSTPQALRAAADEFVDYGTLVGVEAPAAPTAAPTVRRPAAREARPAPPRPVEEAAPGQAVQEEAHEAAPVAPLPGEALAERAAEPDVVAAGERGRSRRRRARRRTGRPEQLTAALEVPAEAVELEGAGEEAPAEEAPEARLEMEFPEAPAPAGIAAPAEAQRTWAELARQIVQELERPEFPLPTPEELGVAIESTGQSEAPPPSELPPAAGHVAEWEVLAAEQQESAPGEAGEGPPAAEPQAVGAAEGEGAGLEPHPAVAPARRSRRRPRRTAPEETYELPAVEARGPAAEAPEGMPGLSEVASGSAPQPEPLGALAVEPVVAPVEEDGAAEVRDEPETDPVDGAPVAAGEPANEAGAAGSTARRYPRRPVRRSRERRPALNSAAQGPAGGSES